MNYHNTNTIRWTPQEGGRLVVRSRYVCYNEPKEVVAFYLIPSNCTWNPLTFPFLGTKLIYDAEAERFFTSDEYCTTIRLEKDAKGAVLPIKAFTRVIPVPNGRKNSTIEWRHGSWQKFLEPSTWKEA